MLISTGQNSSGLLRQQADLVTVHLYTEEFIPTEATTTHSLLNAFKLRQHERAQLGADTEKHNKLIFKNL